MTTGKQPAEAVRQAALNLFTHKGYEGTSIRDIGREAGMSTANIYNYTASKEDLLWEIMQGTMEHLLEGSQAVLQRESCTAGRLVGFIRQHVTYHAAHQREARVGNAQIESLSPARARQVKGFRDLYERRLRAILAFGTEEGLFGVRDMKLASFALLQMGIGVSMWFKPSGGASAAQVSDSYAEFALDLVRFDAATHGGRCGTHSVCAVNELSQSYSEHAAAR